MGKGFGELAKISGIVYYRISPYEQKVFAGAISQGVPNLFRRVRARVLRVVPPFIGTYLLCRWAKDANHKLNRKNPKDFENDT